MLSKSRRRVARKNHYCDGCDRRNISTGAPYLLGTVFPGDDSGLADQAGRPVNLRECGECATRYGRAEALNG